MEDQNVKKDLNTRSICYQKIEITTTSSKFSPKNLELGSLFFSLVLLPKQQREQFT